MQQRTAPVSIFQFSFDFSHMFEFARKNSFLMQFVLFLMIASLVLVLFVDYDMVSNNRPVAKVGKAEVGTREFEQHRQNFITQQQLRNPGADAAQFNTPEVQQQLLEQLIRNEVLVQSANKLRLPISDQSLSAHLQQMIKSNGWLRPDGTADTDAYKSYLAQQGQTPADYEARLRNSLAQNQVLTALAASVTDNGQLQKLALDALLQQREVQVKSYPPAELEKSISLSEEEVRKYYDAHQEDFLVAEQADAEYVVLSLQNIKDSIQLTDEELKQYYEQNRERYTEAEERLVRHILITVEGDDAAAREKAESIRAQVQEKPDSFAELAKSHSADPGSAADGGSLGYFKRDGSMVKAFEDAAFGLKKGVVSEPVKTDYGYHILLVEDIREATFEKLRQTIIDTIRDSQAQARFREEGEQFANMVYEAGDLQEVAKRFGLTVQRANRLQAVAEQNTTAATDAGKAVHAPAFLTELFSEESTAGKQNTPAVDIGNGRLVAGRILKLYPEHTAAFESVQADAEKRLLKETAIRESRKKAQTLLDALKKNDADARKQLAPATVVARNLPALPQPIIQSALRVSEDKLPTQVLVDLDTSGWAVVQVNRIVPASTDSNSVHATEAGMIRQLWGQALEEAEYEQLKSELNVEILRQPESNSDS